MHTMFHKKQLYVTRDHHKILSELDTFGSDSVFSLTKFTREVKVVQPYVIV